MTELDLRALLDALDRHGVRFVVIGGLAVAAHGYVRATEDLDIVPDPDRDNLRALSNALVELEAVMPLDESQPFEPARHDVALRRGRSLTLNTRFGGLDVVQRTAGVPGYDVLSEGAVATDLLGVPVRICSLDQLRKMKEARGTTQDRADLERLPDESDH